MNPSSGPDDIKERLKRELKYQEEERKRSLDKGKQSFFEWIADILKSLYNIVAVEIIGGIAEWLWNLFFGNNK